MLSVDIDVHQKNPSAFLCHGSVSSVAGRFHRVAASQVHPPARLEPLHAGDKLCAHQCQPCTRRHVSLRLCEERARLRGRWGQEPAQHAQPCPSCLRSAIDPSRGARQHATPLAGGAPSRREPLCMGRLSHAWMTHTTLGVCSTTPLRLNASCLSSPAARRCVPHSFCHSRIVTKPIGWR
jgi:hypothetical protein